MTTIPPLLSPEDTPPIRTTADLHLHWQRLMGPLGFGERCLWVVLLDQHDLVVPTIPRFDALPSIPPQPELRQFVQNLARGLECSSSGWSAAFLLSRPGPPSVTTSDLAYHDALTEESASAKLVIRPMFVATSAAIHPLDLPDAA